MAIAIFNIITIIIIINQVADETVMAEYWKALAEWEAEKERQKYEFTITEYRDDTMESVST